MRGYFRIDLTDNCNIRCIMCQAYNGIPVSTMRFMDFDLFARQTRGQLSEWTTIQLGNVAEPTVHPKFADFLRYVRSESDATIHIVTNGKLLARDAPIIHEVGNCLVQVSMDSVRKETHEYIREGSNYNRLIAGLDLLDTKRTRVLLSFTLMNSNIGEYDEMVDFCRSHGFSMSAFPMILRDERGIIPFRLLKESLWFNREALRDWLRKHYGKDYELIVNGAAPGTTNTGVNEFTCNAHNDDLAMDAAGNCVLCGKQSLGDLASASLETLWRSNLAIEFRRQVDEGRTPCMTCDYRQRCLAPSMSRLENHFSETIAGVLKPETRHAIAFGRDISDDETLDRFVHDVSGDFGIFDIQHESSGFTARRVLGLGEFGETFEAVSRHELQRAMTSSVASKYEVLLLEQGYNGYNIVRYLGRFWGLPQALGRLNLTQEEDRERPGIITSDTLEGVKAEILLTEPRLQATTGTLAKLKRRIGALIH